jgi:radical SAM protein with 4Fe4S-binding SPASM domain
LGEPAPAHILFNKSISIEENPLIPFSLVKVRKDKDYVAFNPIYNRDKTLDYIGCRILEHCDGAHTIEEITEIVANDKRMVKTDAMGYVINLLNEMSREGMVAWREQIANQKMKLAAPQEAFWDITAQCNLRCVHCYNSDEKPKDKELSTDEVKRTLEEMSTFGVGSISFSGGEPFMRKDFVEIASHATSLAFSYVSVATNGTLLDPETARLLKHPKLHIQVSIDGDTAEVHDRIRGVVGAFERAVSGLKILLEEGVQTKVCTTANQLNIDRIPNVIQMMQDLGVKNYRVQGVTPIGRGKKNMREIMLPPSRMKSLVEYLVSKNLDPGGLSFTLQPPPDDPVDFSASGACSAGYSTCSITSEGMVVPCTYFWGMNGENVRDHTFQWIWEHSTLLNYFRTIKLNEIKGACRECKWFMRCRGGCRAETYMKGDLFGSNDNCWIAEERSQALQRERPAIQELVERV